MTGERLVVLRVDGDRAIGAERHDGTRSAGLDGVPAASVDALAALIARFPGHRVAWRDRHVEAALSPVEGWAPLLRHDLEIRHAAFLHRSDPVRRSLGAVDFVSPFLIPAPRDRPYGTWLLSPLGGIAATDTLRRAGSLPPGLSFAASLLVLGHRALRGGALLWSDPRLVTAGDGPGPSALSDREAALVVRHTAGRKFLPLWVAARIGDHRLPILTAASAGVARAGTPRPPSAPPTPPSGPDRATDVDVVIATMGRRAMLEDVLADLCRQSLLPRRVVVVEQVPEGDADPGPFEVGARPYDVVYRRLTEPGACNARNIALRECLAHWVLLADDDMRFGPDYLEAMVEVASSLRVDAVVAGVGIVAPHGDQSAPPLHDVGTWPRMWPYFGSGSALATRALFAAIGGFDRRLEGGFGEDYEWGVRARLAGAMVVHAPAIRVAHRHAATGGFRRPHPHPWRGRSVSPVPSPTTTLSHRLWETSAMRRGRVCHYWARRLLRKWTAGPVTMWRQWRASMGWADVLERSQDPEKATAIDH